MQVLTGPHHSSVTTLLQLKPVHLCDHWALSQGGHSRATSRAFQLSVCLPRAGSPCHKSSKVFSSSASLQTSFSPGIPGHICKTRVSRECALTAPQDCPPRG